MEDLKSIVKNLFHVFFKLICWILFILMIASFVGGLYFVWFKCIYGHPVHEERIVFTIQSEATITDSRQSSVFYNPLSDQVIAHSRLVNKQNEDQIEILKSLLEEMRAENEKINKKISNCEYLNVSNLSGFYAALFTAIAVIVGIAGLLGWQTIKDYRKKVDDLKSTFEKEGKELRSTFKKEGNELKKRIENAENSIKDQDDKNELVEWTEKKFKALIGKNLTSIKISDSQSEKIKKFVIKEFEKNSKLEIFYVYCLAFNKGGDKDDFEKAKIILYSIITNSLLEDKEIKIQTYHILGQTHFNLYLLQSKEFNFFKSNDKHLKEPLDKNIKKAIETLREAASNYKKSIELNPPGINETRGNLAMVLIELHKYSISYENNPAIASYLQGKTNKLKLTEGKSLLQSAKEYLEEISGHKSFNQIWDEARQIFYEKRWEEKINIGKDYDDWNDNVGEPLRDAIRSALSQQDKVYFDEDLFSEQLKKESKEFTQIDKIGFPGKTKFVTELKKMLFPIP